MEEKRTRLKTKPIEKMKELADIVKNSETDEIALEFLKDSWEDDFPDLDLGRENLHLASEVLNKDRDKSFESSAMVEKDLNNEFTSFFKKKAAKKTKRKRRRK